MLALLIRHGLTARTGVKLSGWTPGVDLSAAGREQAERLVERLDGLTIHAIYASPLERTVQTAEPLARARNLPIVQREEIGEVRYGGIEGRSLKALAKTKLWDQLRSWPSDVRFPGGESLRETQARAVTALERIRGEHRGQVVAIFSHGDWIKLSMAHLAGVHIDLYRRLVIEPVSLNVVQFTDHGPIIRRLNDTGGVSDLHVPTPSATAPSAVRRKPVR